MCNQNQLIVVAQPKHIIERAGPGGRGGLQGRGEGGLGEGIVGIPWAPGGFPEGFWGVSGASWASWGVLGAS